MNVPHFKHNIVIVSAQNPPNYLGGRYTGAKVLHAIVSNRMRGQAQFLDDCWNGHGICKKYLLHATDMATLVDVLDMALEACKEESVLLNITGGTKLMALAANDWARGKNVPTCYVDTEAGKFIFLAGNWQYSPLPDLLSCGELLGLYGYGMDEDSLNPVSKKEAKAICEIVKLVCGPEGMDLQSKFNVCAHEAASTLVARDDARGWPAWQKLVSICRDAGKLENNGSCIRFISDSARRWCNGVWLEDYMRMTLYGLRARGIITSAHTSIKVRKKNVPNEIDAMFTRGNRLYLIECKTSSMKGKATNPIYKATALQDKFGGSLGKIMLCSIDEPGQGDMARANEFQIKTVYGSELLNLEEHLCKWSEK